MTSKRVVLFVDDNATDFAPQLADLCPSFEINAVEDPQKALEQFRFSEVQPDIVVLDLNFSDVDEEVLQRHFGGKEPRLLGIDLIAAFRRMDPDIPIVMLTAYGELAPAFAAGQSGANHFYRKEDALKEDSFIEMQFNALIDQSHYTYDRAQQQLAEVVADEYRAMEANSPGTVAYWHFEEQVLIDSVRRLGKRDLRVLDVGVGDGRYPEVLLREFPEVQVTGIDFSGRMLQSCRKRFATEMDRGRVRLERCVAERLPFEDASFDLVVAGFGFLSYSTAARVLAEINRVSAADAYILLGYYNYGALFYDVWTSERLSDSTVPITGKIDRDRGVLHLGGKRTIGVRPMTVHESTRHVTHHDFALDHVWTFPTLYASLGADQSKRLATESVDARRYHGYADFSPRLYEQDVSHSASLDAAGHHKGYYTFIRCRPRR